MKTERMILAVCLGLFAAGTVAAKPAAEAPKATEGELTPERRAELEKRMQDLSRQMAEIGRQLGDDRRVRIIEDRQVAMNRAMLGINVDDSAEQPKAEGVLVAAVTPNGPAGRGGVRAGDLIIALDGKPLKGEKGATPFAQLRELMSDKEPGDEAKLKLKREGKTLDVVVKTEAYAPRAFAFSFGGPTPFPPGMEYPPRGHEPQPGGLEPLLAPPPPGVPGMPQFRMFAREWGDLEMVSLSPKLGEYFGAKEGVLVVHAPSARALPLEDGDVIVKVSDRKPASPEQVLRILRSYDPGEKLKLEVLRNRKSLALDVDVPDRRGGMLWIPGDGDGAPTPEHTPD